VLRAIGKRFRKDRTAGCEKVVGIRFALDSSLEEAVMGEPVSESARFPGNWEQYRETRRTQRTSIPNQRRYQWLSSRIP
jgi:hypothetical protein